MIEVKARRDDDCLHVQLAGDVDMAATFEIEPKVDRLLAEEDVRRLSFDLGAVDFIDSAGLGTLLSIRERADSLGIDTAVVEASEPVRRILAATGTGDTFSG
jgi:anti-anti-sigma factor